MDGNRFSELRRCEGGNPAARMGIKNRGRAGRHTRTNGVGTRGQHDRHARAQDQCPTLSLVDLAAECPSSDMLRRMSNLLLLSILLGG
jgi:hypothetical protein